jgi:hypothetical protein
MGDEEMDNSVTHPIGHNVLPRLNPGFKKIPPQLPSGFALATKHVVYSGLGYLVVGTKSWRALLSER